MVAVVDHKLQRKEPSSTTELKLNVTELFEQSGEIAAVDVRRFGMRAGEIIARGSRAPRTAARRAVERWRRAR